MTVRSLHRSLPLLLALLCAAASPAAAQTEAIASAHAASERTSPSIDLSGGYAFLYDSDRGGAMPAGWLAGLAVGLAPNLSLVGEVDGAYASENSPQGRHEYRAHAFMAGARVTARPVAVGTPFAQALLGASCYCGSSTPATGGYRRGLALQFGAGIDLPVTGPLGVRVQGDYRHVAGDDVGLHQVRLGVSAVVRLAPR
jgi:hypothetical protein